MHELSLARDLLESVEQALRSQRARVLRIDVAVGSAAGIVADSLRLAFGVLAEGTCAEGAELEIITVPARSRCMTCGILFEFEAMIGNCPACGRLGGELVSGNEMVLRTIEVVDV